jgi:predicted DNA-binding protein
MSDQPTPILGRPRKMEAGRSTNIYMPDELTDRLREAAAKAGMSLSALVREACEQYLSRKIDA